MLKILEAISPMDQGLLNRPINSDTPLEGEDARKLQVQGYPIEDTEPIIEEPTPISKETEGGLVP